MSPRLYFADASSPHPFNNSQPETANLGALQLPTCVHDRSVTGVFTSVSTLARTQGIEQGTRYTLLFSPTNNTYVFVLNAGDAVSQTTTFGTYSWSLSPNYRQAVLSLTPTSRAVGTVAYPVVEDVVGGMVIATSYNVATFGSRMGIATFNITPVVASETGLKSRL